MIGRCRRSLFVGVLLLSGSITQTGTVAAPMPLSATNQVPGQILASLGRKTLQGHVPAVTASLASNGRVSATQHLTLAIGLPLRNQGDLNDFLQQVCDPASPKYRHYLTPEQFAEKFGPTEQNYQSVTAFAVKNGLAVTGTFSNRTLLVVDGSIADIEKTFAVKMLAYQHPKENRTFYAPDVEPSVDGALPVLHVSGLNNYRLPHSKNVRTGRAKNVASKGGSGPWGNYMGYDFRAAYAPGVALDGTGQMVGLVEFEGYYSTDITAYENAAGLPHVALTNVFLNGYNGQPGPDTTEASLDIEMAVSMAPGLSKVIVYIGAGEDTPAVNNILFTRMATDNLAKQLSCSWDLETDANTDQIFQQFASQGQSFFDASGDDGAYVGAIPTPDDNRYITIVGGTMLTTGASGAWASETTWNWDTDPPSASAGGVSTTYFIPSWQQGISMIANQGSTVMRNIPDVSMPADNVFVIANNGESIVYEGGTSCASPLWAGFIALVNQQAAANGLQPIGFLNPAIYAIGKGAKYASCLHDITTGKNITPESGSKYSAVTGYDLCTGWGTPRGKALIDALAPPVPTLNVGSVAPSTGVTNDTFIYSVNYVDGSGGAPLSTDVCIDGNTNSMQLETGSAADGTYAFATNGLALGSHNYQFKFQAAGGNYLSLPSGSGTSNGPTVMLRVAQPTFSPSDGTDGIYPASVTLSCATTNADIRYTTNGTIPTVSSLLYAGPLTITGRVLITCMAFETGMLPSVTNSLYYDFPVLSVSSASNNYGRVQVGAVADFAFTVQNTGGGILVGSAGGLSDPFQFVSGTNYSLSASQTQVITVAYSPSAVVTNSENISFSGGNGAVCPVTGIGYIPPLIVVTPTNLDFGTELVNCTNGGTLSFNVQNVGGMTLSGTSTVSAPFTVVTGATYNLAAGQSNNVSIRYVPTSNGRQIRNVVFTGGGGATCSVSGATIGVLTIKSIDPDVAPLPGVYSNVYGNVVTNTASSTAVIGATQHVCRGWTMIGNAPTAGTTNGFVMAQTNNATLAWSWLTNFWLDTETSGDGTVNVAGNWFAGGSSITVKATPSSHWHLSGWSGDTNGATISGTNITVKMTQGRTITAIFAIDEKTLKVNSQWGAPSPAAGVYTNAYGSILSNSVLALDAIGGTQVTCRGWAMTGNIPASGATNNFEMTQTNNATLNWLWNTNFLLTTQASGSGTVDVVGGWYNVGSNVTIHASPFGTSRFFGWAGDTAGSTIRGTNITVKMTSAKSVTANFGLYLNVQALGLNNSTQKINIAVTPNDYSNKAAGTTPFARCYAEQSVVSLAAPSVLHGGWKFTGWTGVDSQAGTNATLSLLSNTVVRALYDPAPIVTITNPTSHSLYATTSQVLTIMGKASNPVCAIDHVVFSNNRSSGGTCIGTTNWSCNNGITLYSGTNIITVTAFDACSNAASAKLAVTYLSKYQNLQNLELLEGAVVRQIAMADNLVPGTTNTVQWQVEACEPVLSALRIRLPAGGSVTNIVLNGVLTGSPTNVAAAIGDWQSKVYSFEADWITPNVSTGTCRIRFLTARQDGYAYVNANIPDGTDVRPYGLDGKEIARDIVGGGTTPDIQNETLIKVSPTFETLSQALYRRGCVAQDIQITNNLTPGSVVICVWSILTYPNPRSRLNVNLPSGSNFVGIGTLKATSNTWWRMPSSGTLVEYNASLINDSLAKVGSYYSLKQYYYQYAWTVPDDTGTCAIVFEVVPSSSLTNWVGAILPENADGTNVTDGVRLQRQIGQ